MNPFDRNPAAPFPGSVASAERVTAFLRAVYGWMCAGLAVTGVVAYLIGSSPALLQVLVSNYLLVIGLFIGQLALVFYLSARAHTLAPGAATAISLAYGTVSRKRLWVLVLAKTGASIATT